MAEHPTSSQHGAGHGSGKSSGSLAGGQTASGSPAQEFKAAVNALTKAIQIHHRHLSGDLPTTGPEGDKSQNEMLALMQRAYVALQVVGKGLA